MKELPTSCKAEQLYPNLHVIQKVYVYIFKQKSKALIKKAWSDDHYTKC